MAKINVLNNKNLTYFLNNFLKAVWTIYGKEFAKSPFKDAYLAVTAALSKKEVEADTLKMHLSAALSAVKQNPDLIAAKSGFTYGNQVSAMPAYLANAIVELDKMNTDHSSPTSGADMLAAHSLFDKVNLFYKLAK